MHSASINDGGPPVSKRLQLALFGSLRVTVDGRLIALTKRQSALVAILASTPGGQPRDLCAALLWPETSPAAGRNALKQLVFQTRRRLGLPHVILSGLQMSLDPDTVDVDAWDVMALVRQKAWSKAADLAAGRYADGVEDPADMALRPWLEDVRAGYDRIRADVFRRAAEEAEHAGLWGEAAEYWYRLMVLHPDDEMVASRRTRANAQSLRLIG